MNNGADDWFDEPDAGKDDRAARDREFAEWLAVPLRADERLDMTFDERVMSAVLAEARAGNAPRRLSGVRRRGWWTRPRRFDVSPLGGLAVAALFAALVLAGDLCARWLSNVGASLSPVTALNEPPRDTVHIVRFVFVDAAAESVSLVGDFNGWSREATRLESMGPGGAWSVSVPLSTGRHEYAFVVRGPTGERWARDPFAPAVFDEFDTESSVVVLGDAALPASESS